MEVLQRLALGWMAALIVFYVVFFTWYGGAGKPLNAADVASFSARLKASPSAREHPEILPRLEALMAQDDGREFVMVNLEEFKAGPDAAKQDRAYARAVVPALLRHGSFPIYVGQVKTQILGNNPAAFRRVALVRYRSLRDFLEVFTDPAMAAGVNHKFASMAYTEARATAPAISLLGIRLTVALAFALLGMAGWMAAGRARD